MDLKELIMRGNSSHRIAVPAVNPRRKETEKY
jgi:hypothetical protein